MGMKYNQLKMQNDSMLKDAFSGLDSIGLKMDDIVKEGQKHVQQLQQKMKLEDDSKWTHQWII